MEKVVKQTQLIALVIILISTVIAFGIEILQMIVNKKISLADLILLFLYNTSLSKFYKLPFWKDLNAVKNNNISNFNYYGLINAGSLETINNACKQLKSI